MVENQTWFDSDYFDFLEILLILVRFPFRKNCVILIISSYCVFLDLISDFLKILEPIPMSHPVIAQLEVYAPGLEFLRKG